MGDEPQRLRGILAAEPLLLTPEEAATVLRVGRTTVYALMKSGDLHAVHIGRSCRRPRAELQRYVDRLATPLPPASTTPRQGRRTSTNQGELFDVAPRRLSAPDLWIRNGRCQSPRRQSASLEDDEREKRPMNRRTATAKTAHPRDLR